MLNISCAHGCAGVFRSPILAEKIRLSRTGFENMKKNINVAFSGRNEQLKCLGVKYLHFVDCTKGIRMVNSTIEKYRGQISPHLVLYFTYPQRFYFFSR